MGFSGEMPHGDVVPNSYIVALKPGLSDQEVSSHIGSIESSSAQEQAEGSAPPGLQTSFDTFSFEAKGNAEGADSPTATEARSAGFRGYVGTFSPTILQNIKQSSLVDYVEADQYYQVQDVQPTPPSWGLVRISHYGLYSAAPKEFVYDRTESGLGVTSYVIDTGVKIDHQDFAGRARWGTTVVAGAQNTDNHGHGTHVAGTIAGTKYGVAKQASIVAVKVFPDGSSSTPYSNIIKGLEWALRDAQLNNNVYQSVVNMSVGGPKSIALNSAVAVAANSGMVVVVAAANAGADAINWSPASSPDAITVGAINQADAMPSWSNWGRRLDFNAPGVDIVSCGISSPTAEATMSGTSMASPHIAGLACCLRQKRQYLSFHSLAYELRLRAEGGCKLYPGHDIGTPNLAGVNLQVSEI
jgi:cerevisin